MSCGKVQNPPGFALCRVVKSKTRRVSRHVVCGNMKPVKFFMYPCRGVLHTPPNVPRQRFGSKTGQVLGVSLLGRVKSGGFWAYTCRGVLHTPRKISRRRLRPKTCRVLHHVVCGNMKPAKFFIYPCRGAKAYAPKCSSPKVWV